ncbi:MAG: class I SAM-dependent methyltransferase [Pirellulales bacterium]|nr:class I SAM-dependent methyltransferase [Pirellulales bacterium]
MKRAMNFSLQSVHRVFFLAILLSTHEAAMHAEEDDTKRPLPDLYPYVASDILEWCKPETGVWVDLGAGSGGVALAVASAENDAASQSTIVLLDPDVNAITEALRKGREKGLGNRLVAVVGVAEKMPLPDNSVDLVFSRGSIFFWENQVKGIREIYRVLRPGGQAMIGGGRGSKYPEWARREFTRRRQGNRKKDSPQAKEFARLRDPETFRQWAGDAGITDFQVVGQGALPADDPRAGAGIWLRFSKREAK